MRSAFTCLHVQVKEAREAAREAVALIQQLHRFVAEQGQDGDWRTWASSNLPYSGVQHSSAAGVLHMPHSQAQGVATSAMQRSSN